MANKRERRPGSLARRIYRLPVWLYRAGLGWLLGQRFLLLEHVGRKSGQVHQTVIEVTRHDPQTDTYVVASGYGNRADWYRNLKQTPTATIQVGRRRLAVRAELLSPEASGREMVDYACRNPAAARTLTRLIGLKVEDTEAGYREAGRSHIPFVALHPAAR